jgi:protein SCO1/2
MADRSASPLRGFVALLALIVVAAMLIGGLTLLVRRPPHDPVVEAPPLPVLGAVPAFALTDADGKTITRDDLLGRPWLCDFIFTRCGGTCPIMTSALYQVEHEVDSAADVRFVSVSVDPAHDRPDTLRAYADNNGLSRRRWHFLTGEQGDIWALAGNGFHLPVIDSIEGERLITHSSKIALIDRKGRIRSYYEGTDSNVVNDVLLGLAIVRAEKEEAK